MSERIWKIEDQKSANNTNIAASASEQVIAGTNRSPYFNALQVFNRDDVDIGISLDGLTIAGRYFVCPKKSFFQILPEEDIKFVSVSQTNLDGAVAETANKILFIAMNKKEVF
jgi:hypothetical protein